MAESDERAWTEAEPHIECLFNRFLMMPPELLFPPGYVSEKSFDRIVGDKLKTMGKVATTPRELFEKRTIIVGSAATVRDVIEDCRRQSGVGLLVCILQFGSLPHHLARKNLELFAAEVMPHFRGQVSAVGQPALAESRI